MQKNKDTSDSQQSSSAGGQRPAAPPSTSFIKLNVKTEMQANKKTITTLGISGKQSETVLQKGLLTQLRNTSHLVITKISILFDSNTEDMTGVSVSEVDHAC